MYFLPYNIGVKQWLNITSGLGIAVAAEGQQLSLILQIPKSVLKIPGTYFGLFGNINDDPKDELIASNGNVLSPNSSEENIFNNFGQTCKFIVIYRIGQVSYDLYWVLACRWTWYTRLTWFSKLLPIIY